MALINCPECGKEISDKATICPHCGYPIEKLQQDNIAVASSNAIPVDSETASSAPNHCRICGKILTDKDRIYCDDCRESIKRTAYATKSNAKMKKYETIESNTNIFKTVFQWLAAAFIILIAISILAAYGVSGIFASACLITCSFFISPLSKKNTISFPKWLKIAAPIVFFFAAIITIPSSESKDTANISEVENIEETEMEEEALIAAETENLEEDTESKLPPETELLISNDNKDVSDIIYEDIFVLDLKESWSDYHGKYIRTTFEVDRCEGEYIDSSYKDGYLRIYPDNYREFENGDYITIIGKITGKTGGHIEIEDAHIEAYGNDALSVYNDGLSSYNERKAVESAEYEALFKESAESVSYDDLSRYPDTYKEKQIKVTVKITDVEPDGIIFSGHYEAVISGTQNKVALYDKREAKEPKLIKGDTAIIYGYGDGLTTIKVQDTSGIIPKTIDKYTIPGINIEFVELK